MASGCALSGALAGGDEHLGVADGVMLQEAAKGYRLIAVCREGMQTHAGPFPHRGKKPAADAP